jgi:serine/threonine protein kinase
MTSAKLSFAAASAIEEPALNPQKIIRFGQTKFSDYTKVCVLGKGTYGEVTRCIHVSSGLEVAMKTFFFEVNIFRIIL